MSNLSENPQVQAQSRIIDLFCFAIFLEIHTFFANAVGRMIIGSSQLKTIVVYLILAVLFGLACRDMFAKINVKAMAVAFSALLFVSLSYFFNNRLYSSGLQSVIKTAYTAIIVGMFLGSCVTDFQLLEKKLCKLSTVLALEMIISFLIYHFVYNTVWGEGAMGLSYKLLIPAILMLYCTFKEFKIWRLLLFVALIVIMVLQGSRGPLISVVSFAVLYQLVNISGNKKRVLRNTVILAVLAILFVIYLSDILEWIADMCDKFGFQSKFLMVILEGDFFLPNGRDTVFESVKEIINRNPWGNGFFAERPVIGTYCHNIFLEFILDFGILFGSFFVILYVALIIKKLRFADYAEKNIINILFCAFLIKLFFSGSFWTETVFFVFLSFIIRPNEPVTLTRRLHSREEITDNETCADCQF